MFVSLGITTGIRIAKIGAVGKPMLSMRRKPVAFGFLSLDVLQTQPG